MAKFCGNCGTPMSEGNNNCGKCGWLKKEHNNLTNTSNLQYTANNTPINAANNTIANPPHNTLNNTPSNNSAQFVTNRAQTIETKIQMGVQKETNAFTQFSQKMSNDSYNKGNRRSGILLWVAILLIIVVAGISMLIKYL